MSNLKIGDKIEVKNGEWEERIFIKHGNHKGKVTAICVRECDEAEFLNDSADFNVRGWTEWREIKEPEYVPFDFSDAKDLIGKTVKDEEGYYILIMVVDNGIYISGSYFYFSELLSRYTFIDGTPCGKITGELK